MRAPFGVLLMNITLSGVFSVFWFVLLILGGFDLLTWDSVVSFGWVLGWSSVFFSLNQLHFPVCFSCLSHQMFPSPLYALFQAYPSFFYSPPTHWCISPLSWCCYSKNFKCSAVFFKDLNFFFYEVLLVVDQSYFDLLG